MNKNSRVFHERGFTMKRGTAEKGVRDGNLVWMDDGKVRHANPLEVWDSMNMTAAERKKRADEKKSLGHREVSGLIFQPSESGTQATRREKFLAWQARYFVKNGEMPELKAA